MATSGANGGAAAVVGAVVLPSLCGVVSRGGSGSMSGSLPLMSTDGIVAGVSGTGGNPSSVWSSTSVVVIGGGAVVAGVMVTSSPMTMLVFKVKVVVPVHW